MKKKTYEQPEMQVVKLEQADIICTSTQSDDLFSLGEEGSLGYDEQTW